MRVDADANVDVQTYAYREKVAKAYNRLSVIMMNQQELKMAADLLEKAQILGELFPEVMAVTYNNLGCYYRMKGRNRTGTYERATANSKEKKKKT